MQVNSMNLMDLQANYEDPPGSPKSYMQIADQLAGHAKSELETDVAIEAAASASSDSWLGSAE